MGINVRRKKKKKKKFKIKQNKTKTTTVFYFNSCILPREENVSMVNTALLNKVVSNTRQSDSKEETKNKVKNWVEIEEIDKLRKLKEKWLRTLILELLPEFLEELWNDSFNYSKVIETNLNHF